MPEVRRSAALRKLSYTRRPIGPLPAELLDTLRVHRTRQAQERLASAHWDENWPLVFTIRGGTADGDVATRLEDVVRDALREGREAGRPASKGWPPSPHSMRRSEMGCGGPWLVAQVPRRTNSIPWGHRATNWSLVASFQSRKLLLTVLVLVVLLLVVFFTLVTLVTLVTLFTTYVL